jgi:FkbM family methyltransferase
VASKGASLRALLGVTEGIARARIYSALSSCLAGICADVACSTLGHSGRILLQERDWPVGQATRYPLKDLAFSCDNSNVEEAPGKRLTRTRLAGEAMSENGSNARRSLVKVIRNQILGFARRLGIYITRDPDSLAYEQQLRRILSALRINCVLDVGSYQGGFARMLRRIGYIGLIISFEPVQTNFEVLEQEQVRAEDTKWRTHRLALGAAKGDARMRVFAGTTFHSFLPPSEYGLSRFPDKLQVERAETVPVDRLDNILDELVTDVPDPRIFLKVDTQGLDLDVIRGLGKKVDAVSALQIEMAVNPIYQNATNSFGEALSYLQRLGFQVSGLFPVSFNSKDRVQVVEFDCLMCRPEQPVEST